MTTDVSASVWVYGAETANCRAPLVVVADTDVMELANLSGIVAAVNARHRELATLLGQLDQDALTAPSLLPGWDRLTVVCHLRYGAIASRSVTVDTLAGRPTAFYPEGRDAQRKSTLRPFDGETSQEVVASLGEEQAKLDSTWQLLSADEWALTTLEPEGQPDLGPVSLGMMALLRLTEVEVHGLDLDIGATAWSETFVDAALPARLHWLPTRRSNHRPNDPDVVGTWVLAATDGPNYAIAAAASGVTVAEVADTVDGGAVIRGSRRELLSFLLGRVALDDLEIEGDADAAASFHQAFPAP